jgi:putative FmdB family regulatory protein
MPIYEYRCQSCGQRVSLFLRSFSAAGDARPRCPRCHSDNLRRLMSRIGVVGSEESHIESLADPSSLGDVDESDPQSVGRWMRRMSQETGEDLGPEFKEVVDRLESGQNPEDIEHDLPGIGGDGSDLPMEAE